ncbi:MAG: hypothetical protein CVU71_18205 [Deltaproteobacteria bacterium HGW-Deltaproteobacteria-6]|jgi:PAS domain S-box-containing protein|nr:MAG: hypothetical protein CVU71_18205 [Deltaproteobacteria bacterium HGW-Deltaproteobacteria-6]
MMLLDMRTIFFSYVLMDAVCLAVMIILWRQNRERFAGTLLWIANYAMQFVAILLIVLRGVIPDWASIALPNALVLTGAFFGYLALLRFAGAKRNQLFNYIFIPAAILMHIYLMLAQSGVEARNLNTSIGLLVVTFQCAWFALIGASAAYRPLMRRVGVVFAGYSVLSLLRIGHHFTVVAPRTDFFMPSTFDALMIIAYELLFVALTFSLGLMYNKRLLLNIRTQEEKFFKAYHSSPYALSIARMFDGTIIEVNEGFVKVSGYDVSEIKGKTSIDLKLWARDEDRRMVIGEISRNGTIRQREFQFRRKSGEIITGLFSAEAITINDEKCILNSIEDITEHKKADEGLKETNIYLERLNNALVDAIFVVKYPERVIEYLNEAAINIFGYAKEEVLGKNSLMFYPGQEGYLRSTGIFQETILQKKNLARFETTLQRKNGETFPAWLTASFLKENEMVTKFIVIIQDITEQKRYNETILQLNADLEKHVTQRTQELSNTQIALLNLVDDLNASARDIISANRSLEAVNKELAAFSYSVSHDLRAPLRSIDGFSEALLEDYGDKLDDEAKNYLERIRRATLNMNRLIDDLLSLSRVLKSDFYRQDFDLSAMVREIAGELQQRNMLKGLVLDIQDGIIVKADQRLINIAVNNLLENAWKFTGKTETPHIEFGADVQKGETVFFIRDNGAGFNMEYVDRIFEAFQRLHRMEEFPGTGIGLATVQRIINRHGGRIRAEGEPGKGATFFFTLGE